MFSFSTFRRHLPPTRALVGAGVAFASYFVSTVWKGHVDDQMAAINGNLNRIASIEARLNELPAFQTYLHYWLELIELQRAQIHIFNQTINKDNPNPFPVLELQKDDHRERVFDNLKSTTEELVKTLPNGFLDLKLLEQEQSIFPFAKDKWWRSNETVFVEACFTQLAPVQDTAPGKAYSAKLFGLYKAEADGRKDLEAPYADFGKALHAQLQRLDIGDDTGRSIGDPRTLAAFDGNIPPRDPFASDAKSVDDNLLARKRWALSCLATAKEATFGFVANYLRQLRSEARTAFLVPLEKKKNMIGDLEIFLYVVSGLIALFGLSENSSARSHSRRAS
jgi:hypothetical protein